MSKKKEKPQNKKEQKGISEKKTEEEIEEGFVKESFRAARFRVQLNNENKVSNKNLDRELYRKGVGQNFMV